MLLMSTTLCAFFKLVYIPMWWHMWTPLIWSRPSQRCNHLTVATISPYNQGPNIETLNLVTRVYWENMKTSCPTFNDRLAVYIGSNWECGARYYQIFLISKLSIALANSCFKLPVVYHSNALDYAHLPWYFAPQCDVTFGHPYYGCNHLKVAIT